jgi:hypothetical protein
MVSKAYASAVNTLNLLFFVLPGMIVQEVNARDRYIFRHNVPGCERQSADYLIKIVSVRLP